MSEESFHGHQSKMKCVIVLLVAIACTHCMPDTKNLKEMKDHVIKLMGSLSAELLDTVYVTDLKKNGYTDCKRNCSFSTTGDQITLHLFLTDLKDCTQKILFNGSRHN